MAAIVWTDGVLDVSTVTVDAVNEAVTEIAACAGDDEGAHSYEDSIRDDVLRAIAAGAPNAAELAAAVLKTGEIDFARWCA